MLSAIWKIAALSGVIGIGCFVVLEVHKRLPEQSAARTSADDFQSLEADGAEQPDPLQFAELDGQAPGGDAAEGESYSDPFGSTAQYEPAEYQAEPAGGADVWLTANEEPVETSTSDRGAPQEYEDFSAGEWGGVSEYTDNTRELPQEFTDVAASDDPFATAGTADAQSEPLQPLQAGPAGPGLMTPPGEELSNEDPGIRTAAADGSEPVQVVPVAAEQPAGESIPFDPFSGAGSAEAEGPAAAPAGSEEPEAIDLFGAQPLEEAGPVAAEEQEPEEEFDVVMPADPEAAGLSESTPQPRLPGVEPNPFGAPQPEPAVDFGGQPLEEPAPYDPFGGDDGGFEPTEPESEPAIDFGPEPTDASGAALPGEQPIEPTFADSPSQLGEPSAQPFVYEDDDGPPAMRTAAPAVDFGTPPAIATPANPPARPDYVGDATLDANSPAGPQQPELTVEKVAPQEATVGEPLIYAIRVKNVGSSAAHDVIVEDRIPRGTTLEGTIPQAELIEKRLIWHLGTMEPEQEQTIRIKVVPTDSGEIGSVATVRFVAEVAATTRITTPALALDMTGPQEIAVGEQATYRFTVTNNGESDAKNVFVRNLLPSGLEHPGGDDIEYEVGLLPAGESRSVELTVTGAESGQFQTRGLVSTGSTTRSEASVDVAVIEARLLIRRQGPKRRFVGSTAEYSTQVTNESSETLQQITVVEQVPEGLELAGIPDGGQFDAQRRTITRQIAELGPGAAMSFETSLMARDQGNWSGVIRVTDSAGNKASLTTPLEVAGFPSLAFDLQHAGRPVAVGERVALRMVVKNRGTGAAADVQAQFEIPDNMEFVNAEGPVEFERDGRFVRFATLDEIEADGEEAFDIVLTAAGPGTTRVSAQLVTPGIAEPLRHDQAVVVESDGR